MSEGTPPSPMPVDQRVVARVRDYLDEHGLVTVYAADREMVYTIGLTNAGLPELAIIGAPDTLTAWMDTTAQACSRGDLEIGPAMTVTGMDGYEHSITVRRHDPAADPDPTLARCIFEQELAVRVLDLWSCVCARCVSAGSSRGLLGALRRT